MRQKDAIALIKNADLNTDEPQAWVDFGCGSGTFTHALAALLPDESNIYAIDKISMQFEKKENDKAKIIFKQSDFVEERMMFPLLNGILMANSLHYVRHKKTFIENIKRYLDDDGIFLIVEYNTMQSNSWVPFPVDFSNLTKLFTTSGFTDIKLICEKKSIYSKGNLYACQIRK